MKKASSFILSTALCLTALTTTQALAYIPTTLQSDGKDSRTDYILSASMSNDSSNCGPNRPITSGWQVDTEAYFNHDNLTANAEVFSTGGYFSNGTFTAPVRGFYNVSFSMRISTGAGDFTLRHNNNRVAATGSNLVEYSQYTGLWSAHSVSKNLLMNAGDTLTLWHESGRTTDCSIETLFKYNHLNVYLIRAVDGEG